MNTNAHSIIFFVGVSLAFGAVFWNNKAPEKQIHLLIAGAFLLRLSTCLDPFLHEWDERYHALKPRITFGAIHIEPLRGLYQR